MSEAKLPYRPDSSAVFSLFHMLIYRALLTLAIWMIGPVISADLIAADKVSPRPKIGLALSGGGAKGAAHIGVLRELERLRIPIDYVAGTSMGSIIGGLYAAGRSPDELEQIIKAIDWDDIFSDSPSRENLSIRRKRDNEVFSLNKSVGVKDKKLSFPTGVIQGQKFNALLLELATPVAQITDFDQLRIPFRAVAADIATGAPVVLGKGSLAAAIRASMSVPGAFASVEIDGHQLVDGGIANNLPITVVRDMGSDIVIAGDISAPLLKSEEIQSAISIVLQLSNFLTHKNTAAQLKTLRSHDLLITPDLGDIGSGSFSRAAEAIELGEKATREKRADLSRLSISERAYDNYLASRVIPATTPPMINFVRVNNDSRMADEAVRSYLNVPTGRPLDIDSLQAGINRLYGLDVFETVSYDIIQQDGEQGLLINVHEKRWGPRYLQFGLRFSLDDDSNSLGLLLGYTVTPINRLNGEWRSILRLGDDRGLLTEFYQPVSVNSPYFFNPALFYDSRAFNVQEDGVVIAKLRSDRLGGELAAGRELSNWGQFRFGIRRYTGSVEVIIGPPELADTPDDGAELFAGLRIDTTDDTYFPRSGAYFKIEWTGSRSDLGADISFDQAEFDSLLAKTWGKHTLQFGARLYTTFSGTASVQNRFRTGGLFALPGFSDNSLSGQQLALLRVGYLRRLESITALKTYLGSTLQYGNVFEDEDDIRFGNLLWAGSVYVGTRTVLGPVFLGAGYAESGSLSYYLTVGTRF